MRARSLLLVTLLALLAPMQGGANPTTARTVEARFRPGVHRVELTVRLPGDTSTLSQSDPGALVYPGTAEIFWRRTDRRGGPWFESAKGRVTAVIHEIDGTIRIRGSLREHFHRRRTTIDVTFRRSEGTPFADVYPPRDDALRTSGTSGVRWSGMATGRITGSLGRLRGLKARASATQAISGSVSL